MLPIQQSLHWSADSFPSIGGFKCLPDVMCLMFTSFMPLFDLLLGFKAFGGFFLLQMIILHSETYLSDFYKTYQDFSHAFVTADKATTCTASQDCFNKVA